MGALLYEITTSELNLRRGKECVYMYVWAGAVSLYKVDGNIRADPEANQSFMSAYLACAIQTPLIDALPLLSNGVYLPCAVVRRVPRRPFSAYPSRVHPPPSVSMSQKERFTC